MADIHEIIFIIHKNLFFASLIVSLLTRVYYMGDVLVLKTLTE